MADLTREQLKKLVQLTRQNAHGDACVLGAQTLKLPELEAAFVKINREHERVGELSIEANAARYRLYQQMMTEARRKLSPDQFKKFYQCF